MGGGGTPYLCRQKWRAARYAGEFSIACGMTIASLLSGSGKLAAPWARMHRENLNACATTCGCGVAE
jgi:hypothetical protein